MPALSVLLPVRDAAPWLEASLASLWRQTFRDFEVVAVNDGSSDGSGELLERAARREPSLRVTHTPPRGLPAALNTALERARGRLIARQDADDLSHRRRFEIQMARLAARPETAVIGSRVRLFPAPAVRAGMRRWARWHNGLMTHEAMAREALIDSPLAHGTAVIRRAALEAAGGWQDRGWAEDADLWLRLLESGARLMKTPEVLYGWRQHRGSATHVDARYRPEAWMALRLDALRRGTLLGARQVTLVGVGASLERWRAALAGAGYAVDARSRRRPARDETLAPPVVLVYGAEPARGRWRITCLARGWIELRDFVFVA
jgi:glycosyltransferase involved in cell wall biosynthesis